MHYRNLQITDHQDLIVLWRNCDGISLRDADSRQGMQKYLERNPGLSFVAEADARIVASLMAGHDGRRGYIQHLAVDPEQRNQGIAGRLLELCLQALQAQGIVKSHVHVLNSNQLGRDFWSRRGWLHRDEIEMYSFINGDNENT
jgi:ribosomal protein S18 acetylase RimI-like enzyme